MKRVSTWAGALVLLILAGIAAVLTWLVAGSLFNRDVAVWGLGFTVLVAVAAGLADYFTRENTGNVQGWARLTDRRSLARLGMAIFFGLSTALFAQSFIEPKETDIIRMGVDRVEKGVDAISDKTDTIIAQTAPKPWRAFDNIDGYWGEERGDCRVVYRFERRDHGLIVTLARREAGMSEYRMTAGIIPKGEGDILRATLRSSTAADERSGDALVFTYADDGVTKRLDWLNETRSEAGALKLEPCEAPL